MDFLKGVEFLTKSYAITRAVDEEKNTPMHFGIRSYKMISHLLKNKTEINVQNVIGEPPIHRAVLSKKEQA